MLIVHNLRTYHFRIGPQNIQPDIHKYPVQYMFLHFHRNGHIQLRLNIVYMGTFMQLILTLANTIFGSDSHFLLLV